MNRVRIGVAGLGRIGWSFHARGLAQHPDYRLVAVADPEADRRAQAEQELGCASYATYEAMLDRAGLDAVVIATPTPFHAPMALQAFAKGLHVILEKPMALNKAEADTIAAAAVRAERRLTVYQPHRLSASFRQVLGLVRAGVIGDVYMMRSAIFGYSRRNDWQSLQKFGGGMLNNYGAHAIDQVLATIGFDIDRVFAVRQKVASLGDAEDVVKVVMETRAGVIGEAEISQASVINPYQMIIWGSHGGILIGADKKNVIQVRRFDPAALPPKVLNDALASEGRKYPMDALACVDEAIPVDPAQAINLFTDFAASIRTGSPPAVRPEETLAVMEVLDRSRVDSGAIRVVTGKRS